MIKMHYNLTDELIKNKKVFVLVIPNAKTEGIEYDKDRGYIIRLKAKPISGEANKALIRFFKLNFGLKIKIVSGLYSRKKVISLC